MVALLRLLIVSAVLLPGCAASRLPRGADHPANAAAREAPPEVTSQTLRADASTDDTAPIAPATVAPAHHHPGAHGGHHEPGGRSP